LDLQEIVESAPVIVAILAGGLGTRLGALTSDLPKPMIPIGGRPFLEFVIDSFQRRGLKRIVLLTGRLGEAIERHFGDGSKFGVAITYSREQQPLGTGGAIRDARHLLGDRFLLTYGDVFRRFDYDRFVREHPEPCLAVYERISVGNTEIEGHRVIRFEKEARDLPYIDAGFSVLSTDVIDLLPKKGACSFEEIVYGRLALKRRLSYEIVDHNFCEIGTPAELERARTMLA
jgi:D-glycero-D-manno-heptose 1,7-bisphosphate phosphatase